MQIGMTVLSAFLSPLLVGITLHMWNVRQAARIRILAEKEQRIRESELLSLELLMAVGKLAYATAVAVKRGKANGEVEEGVAAFEKAQKRYDHFIHAGYVTHIQE